MTKAVTGVRKKEKKKSRKKERKKERFTSRQMFPKDFAKHPVSYFRCSNYARSPNSEGSERKHQDEHHSGTQRKAIPEQNS